MSRPDHKREVRNLLTDARELCQKLGLTKGSKRNGKGLLIRCPEHEESDPSCSVTPGKDGTLFCKCHACGWSGDVLSLVASMYGLSMVTDFQEVLAVGAELGGEQLLADEIRSGKPNPNVKRRTIPAPAKGEERGYPSQDEIRQFWEDCDFVQKDSDEARYLARRAIAFDEADELARVITHSQQLPQWAYFVDAFGNIRGNWYSSGFRIVLPVYDSNGDMRSVRGWQCCGHEGAKRLPPRGYLHTGLLLANTTARMMLASGEVNDSKVVIVEGEPDYLTVASRSKMDAVFGVISGGWTQEHALKIPDGVAVLVATHNDDAGNRYAKEVIKTLEKRHEIWRMKAQ